MGLRLGETLQLRVGDIDAQRRQIHVRGGKGRKDRFVYQPALTLTSLRGLWRRHRHPQWLFPSRLPLSADLRTVARAQPQLVYEALFQAAGTLKASA